MQVGGDVSLQLQPHPFRALSRTQGGRRRKNRLGGYTAGIQAYAAQLFLFYHGDPRATLSGTYRPHVTSGPTPDEYHVVSFHDGRNYNI